MDQGTGTQVSGGGTGVGQPMPQNAPGDVGADDLDTRLTNRVEQIANGFRSTIDKRFAPIERVAQTVPQLQSQLGEIRQQLGSIQSYFTNAQEADMDPDERDRRNQARQQQAWVNERAGLIMNSRQQNAAFRVRDALADLNFKWNDERLNWYPEMYAQDPDAWASTVISNAARQYAQDLNQTQQTRTGQLDEATRRRAQEVQQRQQIDQQNAQRQFQAQTTETTPPGGAQMDWLGKVKDMSVEERRAWLRKQQYRIAHGEITQPGQ